MDLMDAIAKRRSVRKYLEKPVSWDDVGTILDAGRLAPSAGNLQNWKFIVITDEAKRKAVSEACLQQHWMATAPVHIVICAEPRKAIQFYGIRGDRLYSVQNCAAATQNMLLAATSCGLGSCWVGAFDEGMLKSAASMIEEARPQAVITVGYPAETPKEPMHYTIENVTFLQRWGSRVGDVDAVMGHYGKKMHRHIEEAGKSAAKVTDKMTDKIKKTLKEQLDKRKQKREEEQRQKELAAQAQTKKYF